MKLKTFAILAFSTLVVSCATDISKELRKQVLDDIKPLVPEGVWTARSANALAQRHGVDMPITSEVYRVLFEDKPPIKAVADLMRRDPREEADDQRP